MSNPTYLTRLIAAVPVVLALALSLASAAPAWAGTYVMRSCNVPGQPSAPLGPWQAAPSANAAVIDTCTSGGSVVVSFAGIPQMPYRARASLTLLRPTDGPQSRIGIAGVRFWGVARLDGSGGPLDVQTLVTKTTSAAQGSSVATAATEGTQQLAPPELQMDPVTTTAVQLALMCDSPPDRPRLTRAALDCYPANNVPLELRGLEARLEENTAPAAAIEGGTALVSGPLAGERAMQFSAKDVESGVERVEAVIGDTVVASRDLRPQCPHVGFAACPETASGILTFDTRKVKNGTYPLTLRVTDAAGNAQLVPSAAPITIANVEGSGASPASVQEVLPLQEGQARLTARFARSSRSSLVLPYGQAVVMRGRLSFGSARPPAKTPIAVAAQTVTAGARERTVGSALTRADGTFSYRPTTRGPSRRIRFVYPAKGASSIAASSEVLSLRVRAATRFTVSLRGTALLFRGRVISGPIPTNGKRLRLQGRAPGFAWTEFATLRTDRKGRFSGRYRLRARRPGVRIAVRVVVPQEARYPYLGYQSSVRTLKVT
jgi:hypothetical protein